MIVGRTYLDPQRGNERVTVEVQWGKGARPRNVQVVREDGSRDVLPFSRRLRIPPDTPTP